MGLSGRPFTDLLFWTSNSWMFKCLVLRWCKLRPRRLRLRKQRWKNFWDVSTVWEAFAAFGQFFGIFVELSAFRLDWAGGPAPGASGSFDWHRGHRRRGGGWGRSGEGDGRKRRCWKWWKMQNHHKTIIKHHKTLIPECWKMVSWSISKVLFVGFFLERLWTLGMMNNIIRALIVCLLFCLFVLFVSFVFFCFVCFAFFVSSFACLKDLQSVSFPKGLALRWPLVTCRGFETTSGRRGHREQGDGRF